MSWGIFMPAFPSCGVRCSPTMRFDTVGKPLEPRRGRPSRRGIAAAKAGGRIGDRLGNNAGQALGRQCRAARLPRRRRPGQHRRVRAWSWSRACGNGTRIAGRPITASSETVQAPSGEITRWRLRDPRRQVGEEGRELGLDAECAVASPHLVACPPAGLLDDAQAVRAVVGIERAIAGGTQSRNELCALAAAEDQQAKRPSASRRPDRAIRAASSTSGRTGLPV